MTVRRLGDHPPLTQVKSEGSGCFFFTVDFPVEGGDRAISRTYGTHTHIRMPLWLCAELGLEGDWRFRLESPTRLCISVDVDHTRPKELRLPLVSLLWPGSIGYRKRLVARNNVASVELDLNEEVDLSKWEGSMSILIEDVELLEPPPS